MSYRCVGLEIVLNGKQKKLEYISYHHCITGADNPTMSPSTPEIHERARRNYAQKLSRKRSRRDTRSEEIDKNGSEVVLA